MKDLCAPDGVRFLVGQEHQMIVTDRFHVCRFPDAKHDTAYTRKANGAMISFAIKRGTLEEYASVYDGAHIYARVLPSDVHEPLDALDVEIAATEARLEALRAERQALLAAAAPRGDRIRHKPND
jgi:hypothetical protein